MKSNPAGLNWHALKVIHDYFALGTFRLCATGSTVQPQLMVVRATSKGRLTEIVALPSETMHCYFGSTQAKDAFSLLLKALLTDGNKVRDHFIERFRFEPNLLVQINEAWLAKAAPKGELDLRPSLNPNRKECILILLHTRQGTIPGINMIVDKPKRHALMGKFPSREEYERLSGRFMMQDAFGTTDSPSH